MLKVYKGEDLTFPDGSVFTYDDLSSTKGYAIFAKATMVVDTDEDGITSRFYRLSDMKKAYSITEQDPDAALSAVIAAQQAEAEAAAQERASLADVQAQLDALAGLNAG